MSPAVKVCGWCEIDTWPWSHTCLGHILLIGFKYAKRVKFYIFRLSYKLTSWPWPSFVTFDLMNMWRFPHINNSSLVPTRFQLFKWGEFYILSPSYNLTSDGLWPWYMTFDRMKNKGFHVVSINQVWFQSDFIFSYEATFTFPAYLTTKPQITFDLDMQLLTSPTNEGFHVASMTHLWSKSIKSIGKREPNVNLFFTTTTGNHRGQSYPY